MRAGRIIAFIAAGIFIIFAFLFILGLSALKGSKLDHRRHHRSGDWFCVDFYWHKTQPL